MCAQPGGTESALPLLVLKRLANVTMSYLLCLPNVSTVLPFKQCSTFKWFASMTYCLVYGTCDFLN